jgi:hypothetical protein
MRFVIVLLSVYILSIAAVPCCFEGMHRHSTELASTENDAHSDDAGLCSPFCVCNACGGCSIFVAACNYFPEPLFSTDYCPFFSVFYSFSWLKGIWQPPKF